jgi:hypothetical protein
MYAIITPTRSRAVSRHDYELVIRDSPVPKVDIQNEYLRHHSQGMVLPATGIKLYAYTLPEPSSCTSTWTGVHQPMDDLFDAMLPGTNEDQQQTARQRVPLEMLHNREHNSSDTNTVWPET